MVRQWLFRQGARSAATRTAVLALLERARTAGDWRQPLPGGRLAVCANEAIRLADAADTAPRPPTCRSPVRCAGARSKSRPRRRRRDGLGLRRGESAAVCTLAAAALGGRTSACVRVSPAPIAPIGLTGSKKLQDVFVDAKVPEALRDGVPVFVCGGDVVWVPGYRLARAFAVPSADAPCVRISVRGRE
jgi:tRNA(Ile)-lysidine synthase